MYDLLLDCLRNYNASNSTRLLIRRKIDAAEVLFFKGLNNQSLKQLIKAKELAYKNGDFPALIEIFEWLKKIHFRNNLQELDFKELEKLFNENINQLKELNTLTEYWWLQAKLYKNIFNIEFARTDQERDRLHKLMQHPLLLNINDATSLDAKFFFYHIHSAYYFFKRDVEKAYKINQQYIELFESNPERITTAPRRYISVLNNFLIDNLMLKKYDHVVEGIAKLRSMAKIPPFNRIPFVDTDIFQLTYQLELNAHVAMKDFETALNTINSFTQQLEKHKGRIPNNNLLTFYYLAARIYFVNGLYGKASKWVDLIIKDQNKEISKKIHCFSRLLNLIIHFENEEHQYSYNLLGTVKRYFKNYDAHLKFEKVFLKNIKTILNSPKNEHPGLWVKFKQELLQVQLSPKEKIAFDYFEFLVWIESKINKKSMLAIIKNVN